MSEKTTTTTKKRGKQVLKAYIQRKDGKIKLHLKTSKDIEEFFKGGTKAIAPNFKSPDGTDIFYYKGNIQKREKVKEMLRNGILSGLSDDAMEGYHFSGSINLAIFRLVGVSKGITIDVRDSNLTFSELEDDIKVLGQIAKAIWQEFIKPIRIDIIVKKI